MCCSAGKVRYFLQVVIALIAVCGVWQGAWAQATGLDPATTQLVVKLNPLTSATIEQINATYSTKTIKPLVNSVGIYLLQVPANTTAKALAGVMAADLRLLYAEPNFVGQAPEGTGRHTWGWGGADPAPQLSQYAIKQLGLPTAWQSSQGAGVVVAVLDSGVQLDHPALAAVWTAESYDFVDDDNNPGLVGTDTTTVAAGHGTHVAGIIHTVAPAARIMPLRVLDNQARGDIFQLAEAIIYATDHGANVINLSLGTSEDSELLDEITNRATALGVTVVAAAGNLGTKERQYPAGSSCVLAITALNEKQQKADFANYGSWLALAVPGVSIYSTLPPSGYGTWSGTSMATPWVAGEAALLYSVMAKLNRPLNVRQLAELMIGTAHSVDGVNPKYRGKLGAGVPAIDVALARLQSGALPEVGGVMSGSCLELPGATLTTAANPAPLSTAADPLLQPNQLFLPVIYSAT